MLINSTHVYNCMYLVNILSYIYALRYVIKLD